MREHQYFLFRVDEIECITCGHQWKKGEVPKVEEAPPAEEEKTWLIRDETLVEVEGRVEEPLETPEEVVEGERLQEARWLVFKTMLDEFPKLRERARRYLEEEPKP